MSGYHELSETIRWRMLVEVAKAGLKEAGYTLGDRVPGRGLSNVWNATKGKKKVKIAIKTTHDRAIAFPPLNKGKNWKTLDNVDLIAVAAIDRKTDPTQVEIFIFKASDVKASFDKAFSARLKAGQKNKDGYGMWVSIDPVQNEVLNVGAGFAKNVKPVAVYPITSLLEAVEKAPSVQQSSNSSTTPESAQYLQELVENIIQGIGQRLVRPNDSSRVGSK